MKKLFLVAVMAVGMLSASAQTKFGYINTDELISLMPEAAKADADINKLKLTKKGTNILRIQPPYQLA